MSLFKRAPVLRRRPASKQDRDWCRHASEGDNISMLLIMRDIGATQGTELAKRARKARNSRATSTQDEVIRIQHTNTII